MQVVGNSLKSLEVSEEKANQRVEEFKREMKTLTVRLKEAENRAENAEKSVKRLQKEVDRLEGIFLTECLALYVILLSGVRIFALSTNGALNIIATINHIFYNIKKKSYSRRACLSIGILSKVENTPIILFEVYR